MRIKFGSLVVDGAGKLGGHYATHDAGGAVLSTNPRKSAHTTSAGNTSQSFSISLAREWASLSENQRNAWRAAASSVGGGFHLFFKRNYWFWREQGVLLANPVATTVNSHIILFHFQGPAPYNSLIFRYTISENTGFMIFKATKPLKSSVQVIPTTPVYLTSDMTAFSGTTTNLTPYFEEIYGAIPHNSVVFLILEYYSNAGILYDKAIVRHVIQ